MKSAECLLQNSVSTIAGKTGIGNVMTLRPFRET